MSNAEANTNKRAINREDMRLFFECPMKLYYKKLKEKNANSFNRTVDTKPL